MRNVIAVVLDKSGSMEPARDATISAFNEFLREQQREARRRNDERLLTLALFDSDWASGQGAVGGYVLAYDAESIHDVPELTRENYIPDGGTALFDAIVRTAGHAAGVPDVDKVVFVILTDGEENSSRTASAADVRTLVAAREAEGWVFVYLAAAADEFTAEQHAAQADAIGVASARRLAFSRDHAMPSAMQAQSAATSAYLAGERDAKAFFETEDA